MEQPEKTYREIIEDGDAQRELHKKQAEKDFNDPVFLREALELEHEDRKRVKRELAAANAEIARLNEVIDSRNRIVDELCAITGEIWPPHALDRVTHMKSELQRQAAKLMTSGFDTAALPVKSTGMEVWRSMAMRYSIALEDIADGATNPVELATKALQKE